MAILEIFGEKRDTQTSEKELDFSGWQAGNRFQGTDVSAIVLPLQNNPAFLHLGSVYGS